MGWTTPQNWTSTPFTASNLNIQLRDNLLALKNPPSANSELNVGTNYTTSSASFVNVDNVGPDTDGHLRHTITTTGGDVFVSFCGMITHNAGVTGSVTFNISLDGTDLVADDGFTGYYSNSTAVASVPISFHYIIKGSDNGGPATAGSHTIRLRWKVSSASITATLYNGATTAGRKIHPQFYVREMS